MMICSVIVLLVLSIPGSEGSLQEDEAIKQVNELFQQFWDWKLVNNPEFATSIGVLRYDNRVNELSLSSFKRRASEIQLFLNILMKLKKDVDEEKNPTLSLNIDLLESDLRQYISGFQFHTYVWPMNMMEGPQGDISNLLNLMKRNTVSDMSNINTRIRLYAQQIDEEIALFTEGIRIRQTLHRKSFESLLKIYKKLSEGEPQNSPFFQPFQEKPKTITNDEWKNILKQSMMAIGSYLQPAFKRLYEFLRDVYLPKARRSVGLSSVPNGKAYYRSLLRYHTTTNLTPKQVHNIGLREVVRITKEMEMVKIKVKFTGSLDQFRQFLRSDKSFGFKDEEEMLLHYNGIRGKVMKVLPSLFGLLPKTPFVIKPVPADIAPNSPAAYYLQPPPNGTGTFFINTYDAANRRRYAAEPLFLHEAVPGHHLQIALKIEHGSPVLFRRYAGMDTPYYQAPATFAMNTAYTEGWGLYSEYLGEEMGMYSDPYVYFGRLSGEMLRACRLVVDTGLHYFGWSREHAINFMQKNTADDLHDITAETDRYITIPGQACAYKIGELKIKELRKLASDKLGDKFDVRKFHDFLLSMGNIPLTVLENQTKKFIQRQLKL